MIISRKIMAMLKNQEANLLCYQSNAICSSSGGSSDNDPTTKLDDDDDHSLQLQCVICLCNVSNGEKYRVLSECNHGFHCDCIDVWLQKNSTCPLCRCPVPFTSMNPQLNNEEQLLQLYDAVLTCFLCFMDHLWTWFVNPLGFEQVCEDNFHSFP
ncbi:hypothetical protein ACH5RR_007011 [Cinchona calisaya]|uniref:RING-type domain-containing protein n=1 Tax=Cinchona calisaya TaxID=153742 RepID=A0ABD3AQM2_9GENT